jgi:hypothetical protein
MNKHRAFFARAVLLTAFVVCVGSRVPAQTGGGPVPESLPVLYAAGWEVNSDDIHAAMVWKIEGSTLKASAGLYPIR